MINLSYKWIKCGLWKVRERKRNSSSCILWWTLKRINSHRAVFKVCTYKLEYTRKPKEQSFSSAASFLINMFSVSFHPSTIQSPLTLSVCVILPFSCLLLIVGSPQAECQCLLKARPLDFIPWKKILFHFFFFTLLRYFLTLVLDLISHTVAGSPWLWLVHFLKG